MLGVALLACFVVGVSLLGWSWGLLDRVELGANQLIIRARDGVSTTIQRDDVASVILSPVSCAIALRNGKRMYLMFPRYEWPPAEPSRDPPPITPR